MWSGVAWGTGVFGAKRKGRREVEVRRERTGPAEVPAAAEDTAPVASLDVVARNLRKRFGACSVSLLFVDVVGRQVARITEDASARQGRSAERIPMAGSVYDEVLRAQKPVRASDGGGQRVLVPVTDRGDTIGVLGLSLPEVDDSVLEQVAEAAHAPAYIIVTDRRFADLHHWGRRGQPQRGDPASTPALGPFPGSGTVRPGLRSGARHAPERSAERTEGRGVLFASALPPETGERHDRHRQERPDGEEDRGHDGPAARISGSSGPHQGHRPREGPHADQ